MNYYVGQVDAVAMERWRADYRGMGAERQMLAASIVWLYRGGKDTKGGHPPTYRAQRSTPSAGRPLRLDRDFFLGWSMSLQLPVEK
jgi:hypothetical protein